MNKLKIREDYHAYTYHSRDSVSTVWRLFNQVATNKIEFFVMKNQQERGLKTFMRMKKVSSKNEKLRSTVMD